MVVAGSCGVVFVNKIKGWEFYLCLVCNPIRLILILLWVSLWGVSQVSVDRIVGKIIDNKKRGVELLATRCGELDAFKKWYWAEQWRKNPS